MNEPTHKEVGTDDYTPSDAAVVVYNPHPRAIKYCPTTEVALKYTNKEKEERHQQRAKEEHGPPPPRVNI